MCALIVLCLLAPSVPVVEYIEGERHFVLPMIFAEYAYIECVCNNICVWWQYSYKKQMLCRKASISIISLFRLASSFLYNSHSSSRPTSMLYNILGIFCGWHSACMCCSIDETWHSLLCSIPSLACKCKLMEHRANPNALLPLLSFSVSEYSLSLFLLCFLQSCICLGLWKQIKEHNNRGWEIENEHWRKRNENEEKEWGRERERENGRAECVVVHRSSRSNTKRFCFPPLSIESKGTNCFLLSVAHTHNPSVSGQCVFRKHYYFLRVFSRSASCARLYCSKVSHVPSLSASLSLSVLFYILFFRIIVNFSSYISHPSCSHQVSRSIYCCWFLCLYWQRGTKKESELCLYVR